MTAQTFDPEPFKSLEHAGWSDQDVASKYNDWFVSLTNQVVEPLLDAAGVRSGVKVLDVASGPGNVAAAAAARAAHVTGIDFSPAMVEQACALHPGLDFREGDAEALDFPDASFDAVVMNFGMLHLSRPDEAISEAFRVLRPAGRFAFTVWADPSATAAFAIVLKAVEKHGRLDVPLPPGPPLFRFSDANESKRSLTQAGFVEAAVVRVPQVWRLPSPDALLQVFVEGAVRTRALLLAQTDEALRAIQEACRDAAKAYETPNGIEVPMPAVLSSASKP